MNHPFDERDDGLGTDRDGAGRVGAHRDETGAVRDRYARRAGVDLDRYSLANRAALLAMQERQRATLDLFAAAGLRDFASLRLIEVGSGSGDNLLEFLRLGFAPAHLEGIELLEARHATARSRLPEATRLVCGDAVAALEQGAAERFDIVHQSTVFSSLLDDAFQERLARAMWRAVRPGGGVLWYDFCVDNPKNRDVRGVPAGRVRALFPAAEATERRVTLAPPLARPLARLHPWLHDAARALPLLRTHRLVWLAKQRESRGPADAP